MNHKNLHYYYESVGIAKELGITGGIGNNKFNPKAYITRQDMMVMIQKALRLKGMLIDQADHSILNSYTDKLEISDALDSIAIANL